MAIEDASAFFITRFLNSFRREERRNMAVSTDIPQSEVNINNSLRPSIDWDTLDQEYLEQPRDKYLFSNAENPLSKWVQGIRRELIRETNTLIAQPSNIFTVINGNEQAQKENDQKTNSPQIEHLFRESYDFISRREKELGDKPIYDQITKEDLQHLAELAIVRRTHMEQLQYLNFQTRPNQFGNALLEISRVICNYEKLGLVEELEIEFLADTVEQRKRKPSISSLVSNEKYTSIEFKSYDEILNHPETYGLMVKSLKKGFIKFLSESRHMDLRTILGLYRRIPQ